VPAAGLAIDVGILYAIKARLSMAVDSGALAGARALSRGADGASQQTSAQSTATAMVKANFPTGYYSSYSLTIPTPTVDTSVSNQRSVTVTATVTAPLYFMRWLRANSTNVAASATVTRKDVNVMIVLDRSGSLNLTGNCGNVRQAAVNFVNQFASGRDNVGLVTFATSSLVDFPISSSFSTASPSVTSIINSITCTGATNSAQALWQAYTQLVQLNQPGALNFILFFTDGQPTAITASAPISGSSSCSSKTNKTAVLASGYYSTDAQTPVAVGGLWNPTATAQPMSSDNNMFSNSTGCSYASNWSGGSMWNVANDVPYIPSQDVYGNSTNNGYQSVTISNGNIAISSPQNMENVAVNAADNAGYRIRTGANISGVGSLANVTIFCIGLGTGNNIGPPQTFLERMANDPSASSYISAQPAGLFVNAATGADLGQAFARVASEILRIAR